MNELPLYLDYCATTPCDPRVVEQMLPYFGNYFGNAASKDHHYGWMAKEAIEFAREQVAELIGARPQQVIFTSGATESINLALKGLVEGSGRKGNHIITTKVEHEAVLDSCRYLEQQGNTITYLEVNKEGDFSLEALERAIRPDTLAIAIMYANNETGVINPVKEIGAIAKKYQVLFMCDATQAVGKIPVDVQIDGIDLLCFSAHKIYGPKGVGALFISKKLRRTLVFKQQHGGAHEGGYRGGTLNTAGIVGFGRAATICSEEMEMEGARLQTLRNRFEASLLKNVTGLVVNGGTNRLPHVSNILLSGIDAEGLLLKVSKYLALSRGSACSGLTQQVSHVLTAMGLTKEEAHQTVRISLGRFTKMEDMLYAITILSDAIKEMLSEKRLNIVKSS
ncbi:cysteine desulfurase family protein [Olivibacter sp. CPCC 100613]|uniref:cysteine desulfurase family protein n=1 Tax=Olivibacter sp. CPCC 100613 TaxID=3079931 RepID=UPI002FFBFDAC